MPSILIKRVLVNGQPSDIFIEGNIIRHIIPADEDIRLDADRLLDGNGKVAIPGFVNTHTHAAMTLFRGFADDISLQVWLEKKIWPHEAKLSEEDVYWGTKLACLEMIRSGTTTFFDMYHHPRAAAQAAHDMGLRAFISGVCFDRFSSDLSKTAKLDTQKRFDEWSAFGSRVRFSLGPHAIYSVSGEMLQWIHRFALDNDCLIQLHLAETEHEVDNAIRRFGISPVRYLHGLGILSPRLIIAHALYVDNDEIALLADNGVKVAHNPASNMKLASGFRFKFSEMSNLGISVGLGTDGCASSNNLDMIETMKLAALLGKAWRNDPTVLSANDVLLAATQSGAHIAGINAGRIAEGALADLSLVNTNSPAFVPDFNFVSNLVYAANSSCIDTVICDGNILMENGIVDGQDHILRQAALTAHRLITGFPHRN
ncbi:MAG: amidohydrolase [Tannerellaceae bacterium]|jgi:5-methylthioadenosine/S-adenosylhomocysteine deaminase|nr:amidohydrolase [Tannerellaceae bacterium]